MDLLGQDLSTGAGPPGGRYKNAVVVLCSGLGKGVQAWQARVEDTPCKEGTRMALSLWLTGRVDDQLSHNQLQSFMERW